VRATARAGRADVDREDGMRLDLSRIVSVARAALMRARACGAMAQSLGAALRDTRGAAAVEFALVLPVLTVFLLPVADLGMQAYAEMQLQTAVQSGARYAVMHGWSTSGIQSAVTNATAWTSLSVAAPVKACGCASGTSVAPATCGDVCANGEAAGTYVTVSASLPFTPIFPYQAIGASRTLNAQSTVRIR
jgi:Flp pilus assembly protein TadG